MVKINRADILERLVELFGLDTVLGELEVIAHNKGYDRACTYIDRAAIVANEESYEIV